MLGIILRRSVCHRGSRGATIIDEKLPQTAALCVRVVHTNVNMARLMVDVVEVLGKIKARFFIREGLIGIA